MRKKVLFWLIILFLLLVWWFAAYISKPSVGIIKRNNVEMSASPTPIDIFSFDGEYFSFKYSGNYELRHNEIKDVSLVDQITLWGKSGFFDQIIAYRQSSVTRIDDISAVQMRRQNPDKYVEKKINIDGVSSILFESKDKIEFTVISLNDNKILTIGLSANSNDKEKYLIELNRTLDSFKWKKL